MHVDRARFLFLTTAIAAASCGRTGTAQSPSDKPVSNDDSSGAPVVVVEPVDEQAQNTATTVSDDEAQTPSGRTDPARLAEICQSLQGPPGPSCESIDQAPKDCEQYSRTLRPAAAEHATHCLGNKSGRQAICSFGVTMDCFLQGARVEPKLAAANSPCRTIMRRCGHNRYRNADMTMANCQAVYSAVKPHLQNELVSCISEGCGVASCMYYLE